MRLLLPTLVEFPLAGNLVLPVGFLLLGDFSRSSSSKTCERKYFYIIGWDRAKVIGTEQNRYKRWVKEAIEIRKRRGATMNRNEGQYFLSHVFDELLLEKSPKRRKPTGNTKFPASGNSTSVGSSSLI